MKLRAYSIYDNKALIYNPPFFAGTDGAAMRSFIEVANDLQTSIGRHPGDYSLWCIGEFDDQHGLLTPCTPLLHVSDATAVLHRTDRSADLFQPVVDLSDRFGPNGKAS